MPPVLGACRWVLYLPGCTSLKAKRKIVRGLRDRLKARFDVSAAETDFQDLWQKTEICAVLVTSDRTLAESVLSKLDREVEAEPRVQILEHETVFY